MINIENEIAKVLGKAVYAKEGIYYIWRGNEDVSTEEVDSSIVSSCAAEVTRIQAEYDANQYQRDRANAYPSLQDQADMQFHDLINGTTTWQDAIQAVKDAHPKS